MLSFFSLIDEAKHISVYNDFICRVQLNAFKWRFQQENLFILSLIAQQCSAFPNS